MAGRVRGRVLVWAGAVVAVAAAAGLVGFFALAGLDKADRLASVMGAFVGLAGLVTSGYGIVLARRAEPAAGAAQPGQQIAGSSVGGDLTQVKGVTGDVRVGGHAARPPGPSAVPPATERQAATEGQSVRDSQVAGGLTQIEGVGGDAEVGR